MKSITCGIILIGLLAMPRVSAAQSDSGGSVPQALGGLALGAYSGLFLGAMADDFVKPDEDSSAFLYGGALLGATTGAVLGATSDGRVSNGAKGALIGFAGAALLSEILLEEGDTGPLWLEGGLFGAAIGAAIGFAISPSGAEDSAATSVVLLNLSF